MNGTKISGIEHGVQFHMGKWLEQRKEAAEVAFLAAVNERGIKIGSLLASAISPHMLTKPFTRVKGWGQNAKLGPHTAIWGKLGTALQAYALNPCTKFPPNPTSRKVNT